MIDRSQPEPSYAGRLLVAAPALVDPNFARAVVLVLEHTEDGALGVVLDRPSDTPLAEALPAWAHRSAAPAVVFVGGPVSPTAAIALAHGPAEPGPGWAPTLGGLGTVDLSADPAEVATGDLVEGSVRVFAGFSGWGVGQLEAEVAEGAWFVVDRLDGDTTCARPEDLWRVVLARQPMPLRLLATYPPDPTLN